MRSKNLFHALFASALSLTSTLAGCALDPATSSHEQALAARLTELDPGRATGVFYGYTEPPEPDRPITLELLFTQDTKLVRRSTYSDLAGGRSIVVTSDPPGAAEPPNPDKPTSDPPDEISMSILDRSGSLVSTITSDPPGASDPAGELEPDHVTISVRLVGDATVNVFDANGKLIGTLDAAKR